MIAAAAAALAVDVLRPANRLALGVLDELAHAALGVLVAAWRPPEEAPAIVGASILIDIDHAPSELGYEWLRPAAKGRPYPHTALALIPAGLLAGRGAVIGLAAHLARDLTDQEAGVRLLWPLSLREFHIAPWLYPLAIGALCVR